MRKPPSWSNPVRAELCLHFHRQMCRSEFWWVWPHNIWGVRVKWRVRVKLIHPMHMLSSTQTMRWCACWDNVDGNRWRNGSLWRCCALSVQKELQTYTAASHRGQSVCFGFFVGQLSCGQWCGHGAALGMPSVGPPFLVPTDGDQQLHHMACRQGWGRNRPRRRSHPLWHIKCNETYGWVRKVTERFCHSRLQQQCPLGDLEAKM